MCTTLGYRGPLGIRFDAGIDVDVDVEGPAAAIGVLGLVDVVAAVN